MTEEKPFNLNIIKIDCQFCDFVNFLVFLQMWFWVFSFSDIVLNTWLLMPLALRGFLNRNCGLKTIASDCEFWMELKVWIWLKINFLSEQKRSQGESFYDFSLNLRIQFLQKYLFRYFKDLKSPSIWNSPINSH